MLAHDRAREPQERRILVAEATRVTDLMSQLAANLLVFARKEQLDRELTDVGELANSTVRFLKRIIGNGIGLQIQAGKCLNARINPAQFQTALINLVVNARDAMPDGGCICIEVGERPVDAEQAHELRLKAGRYIIISVADKGRGMPKESLDRAFELFYTTKPAGTGLGLATVDEFVANVGGSARIKSELNRGTTVELLIPLYEEAAEVRSNSPSLAP
jgi:signal transduction histidine kinase